MHARPSTSRRTRPSFRSPMPVTVPRRRLSTPGGLDELEGHPQHGVEVGDGDLLLGRVDVLHAVREVDARQATGVEDVRVGAPAHFDGLRREARAFEGLEGKAYRRALGAWAISAISLFH